MASSMLEKETIISDCYLKLMYSGNGSEKIKVSMSSHNTADNLVSLPKQKTCQSTQAPPYLVTLTKVTKNIVL